MKWDCCLSVYLKELSFRLLPVSYHSLSFFFVKILREKDILSEKDILREKSEFYSKFADKRDWISLKRAKKYLRDTKFVKRIVMIDKG